MAVKTITITRCIGIDIPKNIDRASLLLKNEGIAITLMATDNTVEINGATHKNFLLIKKTSNTESTGIIPNTETFHQSIQSHFFGKLEFVSSFARSRINPQRPHSRSLR